MEMVKMLEIKRLVSVMKKDPMFEDVSVNNGGIGFHVDPSIYFDDYEGHDVIWNDCEDCEGEGQVNVTGVDYITHDEGELLS